VAPGEGHGRPSRGWNVLLISFADEAPLTPPVLHSASSAGGHDESVTRQLEDELETTREELQGSIGDLESSNEELKVVNEEVMSVNEELRSSNEELEASKEEFQSLNEELSTVNAQLEDKVTELEQANNDLDNLLTSTNIATIFLDTNFHVRRSRRLRPGSSLTPADLGRRIGDVVGRGIDPDLPAGQRGRARAARIDQQGGAGAGRPVRAAGAPLPHARQPDRGRGDHLFGRRQKRPGGPALRRGHREHGPGTPTGARPRPASCRRIGHSIRPSGSRRKKPSTVPSTS
jgi:hypothetical protein